MITLSEKDTRSATAEATPALMLKVKELVLRVARTHDEREQLSRLSSEQLRDIGVTEIDAEREHNRGFFDLPVNRW